LWADGFQVLFCILTTIRTILQAKKGLRQIEVTHLSSRYGVWPERNSVTNQFSVVLVVVFLGSVVGGAVGERLFSARSAQAQKANGVNAEEFLLLDQSGKARAGLGLDANGEVGFVLTSKDGSRTLTLSPDDPKTIKLAERGGRVLWAVP
jgi:hypothetical protein